MRQHMTAVFFVACAMLLLGAFVMPERARAQLTCSAANAATAPAGEIRFLVSNSSSACDDIDLPTVGFYDNPRGIFSTVEFLLGLPGNSPITGDTNPVKVFARNASGTVLDISMITCTGATIDLSDSAVGEISLPAGGSCELYVFWEDGDDDISFSGGTLSRTGDIYAITEAILAGGAYGGTAATTVGPSIDVERNGVSFSDGDTDDQGTQTAGTPITLTYAICNTGSLDLADFNVAAVNTINLVDPGAPDPVVKLVDETNGSDLGTPRTFVIGECLDVSATFTPNDPIDFSFDFLVSSATTTPETLTITVKGSDSSASSSSGAQTVARTQRIISNFMGRRASQIVGQEPDLSKRLGGGGTGSGANGPVGVTGEGTASNNNLAFATSLRQAIGSTQVAKRKRIGESSSRMALGAKRDTRQSGSLKDAPEDGHALGNLIPQPRLGLWAEGSWARVDDDTAKSDFGLLYVGADYRFRDGLVVGLIAQFDRTDEEDDVNDYAIEGKGWMVGPYVVARLSANLIFDARAAWGKSNNEVSPYNTYTDDFDGQRKLLRGRLTGDFTFGGVHIAPHVGVIYFEEKQKAYTDSNGYTIAAQTVELGRLTFGPKFSTSFRRPDGTTIAPFVAINGIWDFKRTDQIDIDTGLAVTGSDKFRARTEAGLSIRLPQGVAITGEGFYDGIGADGYNAYGGSLKVGVPF
ncbi:MAG: autotransporter outer membrane beta-barrel domain-containing protein [Pseudomonadota bacterium]